MRDLISSLEKFGALSESAAALLKVRIDSAEQFLKAGFGAGVLPNASCAVHCSTCALAAEKPDDHKHESVCVDCGNVFAIHEFFGDLEPVTGRVPVPIDLEERDRHTAAVADYKEHGQMVTDGLMRLITHLVRERHANDFRADIIRAIENETEVVVVIDWVRCATLRSKRASLCNLVVCARP